MLKTIRPVSMLLLLAGLPTSLTHAGITHRDAVEQIQQNNPCTGIVKDASGETIMVLRLWSKEQPMERSQT